MNKLWKPWYEVARLRPELRDPGFTPTIFTADLYEVITGKGPEIYRDPTQFFGLTYATRSIQQLAKDVLLRLAGRSDRAVHQLELTYGGGKTHTLLTLLHLVTDPDNLPDLQAVREITTRANLTPVPKARVAALPFDRLDTVMGIETLDPDGNKARFRNPWNVLAWQIGGEAGLAAIGSSVTQEREEMPFTNVLVDLLRLPMEQGMGTLVLMDEVLMWARTVIDEKPEWRQRIQDFFQCLTQAVASVPRCVLVVSLLANDLEKMKGTGRNIMQELYGIFKRESEVGITPIDREEVAVVLRRRFFEPDMDQDDVRQNVIYALEGIAKLDEQTERNRKDAESRYIASFPFHPDLTDVLYARWTSLPTFQQARGVLRAFALGLRDAANWDKASPLVASNIFIGDPDANTSVLSEAASDLTGVARQQVLDGINPDWPKIIEKELEKARELQRNDFADSLMGRELEQAVFSVFLYSEPQPDKYARTRELMALLGHTRPDKITLIRALERWARASWYLDENALRDGEGGTTPDKRLPESWRYGFHPNLTQMHDTARERIDKNEVERQLEEQILKADFLIRGATPLSVKPSRLPRTPADISDDGVFQYVVLGPKAVSESGKPSAEATRYIEDHRGVEDQRVYRNAILVVTPKRGLLDSARDAVRDMMAWERVREDLRTQDKNYEINEPQRANTLNKEYQKATTAVPNAIRSAYCIVVTRNEKGDVQAFEVNPNSPDNLPLFAIIKKDSRARIQDTAISADALLPGGQYDLWRDGTESKLVAYLIEEFARNARLQKLLGNQAIYDTVTQGCRDGVFVMRLPARPGDVVQTYWMEDISVASLSGVLTDPQLEIVLPDKATLVRLNPRLLEPPRPGMAAPLPELWTRDEITIDDLQTYFAGGRKVTIAKVFGNQTYDEPFDVPRAEPDVIADAVGKAVREGYVCLVSGASAYFKQEVSPGIITSSARLLPPPQLINTNDIVPENLPGAWTNGAATLQSITAALVQQTGRPVPLSLIRDAVNSAWRLGLLDMDGLLPQEDALAVRTVLRIPENGSDGSNARLISPNPSASLCASAALKTNEIQNLADVVAEMTQIATDNSLTLTFNVNIELDGSAAPPQDAIDKINTLLSEVAKDLRLR